MIANDKPVKRNNDKVARALLSRDGHTWGFDGQHVYYYINDIDVYI